MHRSLIVTLCLCGLSLAACGNGSIGGVEPPTNTEADALRETTATSEPVFQPEEEVPESLPADEGGDLVTFETRGFFGRWQGLSSTRSGTFNRRTPL